MTWFSGRGRHRAAATVFARHQRHPATSTASGFRRALPFTRSPLGRGGPRRAPPPCRRQPSAVQGFCEWMQGGRGCGAGCFGVWCSRFPGVVQMWRIRPATLSERILFNIKQLHRGSLFTVSSQDTQNVIHSAFLKLRSTAHRTEEGNLSGKNLSKVVVVRLSPELAGSLPRGDRSATVRQALECLIAEQKGRRPPVPSKAELAAIRSLAEQMRYVGQNLNQMNKNLWAVTQGRGLAPTSDEVLEMAAEFGEMAARARQIVAYWEL